MRKSLLSMAAAAALTVSVAASSAMAAGVGVVAPTQDWSWTGLFGKFDKASAQRGLQVYTEVCGSCHGLKRIAFRNLMDLGYTEDQVKALASQYEVEDGPNEDGEMYFREARPSDRIPSPFPNKEAAVASNGAYPPDLSLIVKARASGKGHIGVNFLAAMSGRGAASGSDYIYGLLTGYDESQEVPDGKYYNTYYPGHVITMAPPLYDEGVEYTDGTVATIEQQARDIVTFLSWASEPELEQRKAMGLKVMLFLFILLGLVIAAKRRLWASQH